MTIKSSKTFKNLLYLLSTFVVGFILLIGLHIFFLNLIDKLDKQTINIKHKLQIGEYIAEDLFKIRAEYYALATTANSQGARDIIINTIDDIVVSTEGSLDILENGGTLKRFIELNVAGHANTIKYISYYPENKNNISLVAIDLRPKLLELSAKVETLDKLLAFRGTYQKQRDNKSYARIARKIRRYYKTSPAFFTRISENVRRLLYEGEIEMKKLNDNINSKKQFYLTLEIIFIFFIILIVLVLGYFIAKQINNSNQKLHEQQNSIRGILDAQPNIIVVTDGDEMVEANQALVNFFDHHSSFQEFRDEHACICDFFETDIPNDEYIVKKDYDGRNWVNHLLDNPNKNLKVIMKKGDELYHFSILARKKIISNDGTFIIVVSLNDITSEVKSQLKLKKLNDNLELMVNNKTKELQELNENLEQRIIIEANKVREKDKQMIQQARFAALGEMIGNIAHQWRQPLSAINSTASGMQLQLQLNLTNDEEINESYSKIMDYVNFLTQTIEDFRNFFKEEKENVDFNIIDVLTKTLSITNATYKDTDITLINKCTNDKVLMSNGMPSELSQVFLNILTNAKDATLSNNIEEKFVHIRCLVENGYNVVHIQDNAGGIPANILEKIFDPYFTTKHQSQGTGIGLYMSKNIVEKNMNGIISVKNIKTKIDNQYYNGACFRIAIPIKDNS